jgi:hypothetical protein
MNFRPDFPQRIDNRAFRPRLGDHRYVPIHADQSAAKLDEERLCPAGRRCGEGCVYDDRVHEGRLLKLTTHKVVWVDLQSGQPTCKTYR